MLFVLALIPVIGLLAFIYFKDRKEKEPFGMLVGLFFAGMATVVTALIYETAGEAILNAIFPEDSVLKQFYIAIFIVAFAEELGKYLVLRLFTWKNKNFNYSYDAIVYSVFVSLGFAAFENIVYVFENGVGTAIARMLTAVPGHACFAVFMGFFYSKAKYASLTQNKGGSFRNKLWALLVPIGIHGIYDALLMGEQTSEGSDLSGVGVILWFFFVIALFVVSFILVHKSAKNDFCIVTLPEKVQTIFRPNIVGNWTCTCGSVNRLAFCPRCGKQRPLVTIWYCPKCGSPSSLNFCGNCGCPKPDYQVPVQR